MKCNEFENHTKPFLEKGVEDNDRWVLMYVSAEEDKTAFAMNCDSGDALMLIAKLVVRYGIDPEALAQMVRGDMPFFVDVSTMNK